MKIKLSENINTTDNLGNELSPEQIEFFKDSKVRDENGRLMVCYHGTKTPGFTKFNPKDSKSQFGKYKFGNQNAIYFTALENTARGYTELGIKENGNIYECYLNLTHPYIVDNSTDADIKSWKNIKDKTIRNQQIEKFEFEYNQCKEYLTDDYYFDEFGDPQIDVEGDINDWLRLFNVELRKSDYNDHKGNQYYSLWELEKNSMFGQEHEILPDYTLEELFDEDMYEEFRDAVIGDYDDYPDDYYHDIDTIIRWVLYANTKSRFTHIPPYDGIIVSDIKDTGPVGDLFDNNTTDYVVFDARKIKSITNKTPTDSEDINEELIARGESEDNYSNRYNNYSGKFFVPCDDYVKSHLEDKWGNEYGQYVIYDLDDTAKIYEGTNSYDLVIANPLTLNDNDYDIIDGFIQEDDTVDNRDWLLNNEYTPEEVIQWVDGCWSFYAVVQYMASVILKSKGYDGAHWRSEDTLDPEQYQIWNLDKVKKVDTITESINESFDVEVLEMEDQYDPDKYDAVHVEFYEDADQIGEVSLSGVNTDDAFLYDLEVFEEYRGQGYGNKIMKWLLDNYPNITNLTVSPDNTVAINLYEKFGFHVDRIFDDNGKEMFVMLRKMK